MVINVSVFLNAGEQILSTPRLFSESLLPEDEGQNLGSSTRNARRIISFTSNDSDDYNRHSSPIKKARLTVYSIFI